MGRLGEGLVPVSPPSASVFTSVQLTSSFLKFCQDFQSKLLFFLCVSASPRDKVFALWPKTHSQTVWHTLKGHAKRQPETATGSGNTNGNRSGKKNSEE